MQPSQFSFWQFGESQSILRTSERFLGISSSLLGDLGNNIDGFIEVSQQPCEFGYRKPSLEVVGRNLLRLTEETAMSHPSKAQLPTYSKATALF